MVHALSWTGRLIRTLLALSYKQLWCQIKYRVLPTQRLRIRDEMPQSVKCGTETYTARMDARMVLPTHAQFIGLTKSIQSSRVWLGELAELPRLWLYNLHYFDDLRRPDANDVVQSHLALMRRWIRENPYRDGPGWEPYPLSIRITNWIQWSLRQGPMPYDLAESLANQARELANQIEHHLRGNHVLANAVALWHAGLYFEGPESDRWHQTAERLLSEEFKEQILSDGGHFERSPMYHAVVLVHLLDAVNIGNSYSTQVPIELKERLSKMLTFLQAMTHPDSRFAHFNDSAQGVAPTIDEVLNYAERLGFVPDTLSDRDTARVTDLSASGYVRLEYGGNPGIPVRYAIFDAAPVAAPYLLGHGHADTLSFEYGEGSTQVVVNSGVSTYEVGPTRAYERGTISKSTVCLDNTDNSEVWSSFRCGRAARPFNRTVWGDGDHANARASHDGYRALRGGGIDHTRELKLGSNGLEIADKLRARYRRRRPLKVQITFPLAPGIKVEQIGNSKFILRNRGRILTTFEGAAAVTWEIVEGFYSISFGVTTTNSVIRGTCMVEPDSLPIDLDYSFKTRLI